MQVNDIAEASKSFLTLPSMVDQDVQTNSVRTQGSHSRNLLKIKRGLDFLRVLMEQVLLTECVHFPLRPLNYACKINVIFMCTKVRLNQTFVCMYYEVLNLLIELFIFFSVD